MKLIAQLICCLLFALPLHAEYFIIKSYDVKIVVSEDAYFDVIETINVQFTQPRRGIYRNIPYRYVIDGKSYKTAIKNVEVEGWKKKVSFENGLMEIRIGDKDVYVEGEQEYVIKYRIHDAFLWTDTHTEFYWNVHSPNWDVPVTEAAYSIEFPKVIDFREEDLKVFTGPMGSTSNNTFTKPKADINSRGKNVFGKSTAPLNPREGITVAIKLPKELIPQISPLQSLLQKNKLMGIPAALLALLTGFWWKNGKNKRVAPVEEDIYYPPQGYSPSEMGVLIDNRADYRDITCLLPYWAEQGIINIHNRPTDHPDGLDMRLQRLKDLPEDAPQYQRTVFDGLFKDNDTVYLNEFNNSFYTTMAAATGQIRKILVENELYDPQSYRLFHSGWLLAISVIGIIGGILFMALLGQIVTGIILLVTSIIAFVFHFLRPRFSKYGREMMAQLKSFKRTLKNPDRDIIQQLLKKDPKYFEHVFPYAIAFGLDDTWLKETKGLFQTPVWYGYYGHDHHNYAGTQMQPSFQSFTEGFKPQSIQTVFTSAPASSSGGGGGGGFSGGSSGGGFGGGGGGSW